MPHFLFIIVYAAGTHDGTQTVCNNQLNENVISEECKQIVIQDEIMDEAVA